MMWTDDHRYHSQRLAEIEDELNRLRSRVWSLLRELADDDMDGTNDSRTRLAEARLELSRAAGSVEAAREQLPEAKVRPPLPRLS